MAGISKAIQLNRLQVGWWVFGLLSLALSAAFNYFFNSEEAKPFFYVTAGIFVAGIIYLRLLKNYLELSLSISSYLLFAIIYLPSLMFWGIPFYWFEHAQELFQFLLAGQFCVFILFWIAGEWRFDRLLHHKALRAGFYLVHHSHPRFDKGVIYVKENPSNFWAYKKRFNSSLAEAVFQLGKYFVITMIILLGLLGGGAPVVLLELVEYFVPAGSQHSPHHIVMYMLSLSYFAFIGYLAPAVVKTTLWWFRLESDIQQRYGQVKYCWPAE